MSIEEWLKISTKLLENAAISTARLDCELLLCDELQKDRVWIHTHSECTLNKQQLSSLGSKINRRSTYEPIAYIRGVQEFYGRKFYVSPATLTPRPETETLVELAIKIIQAESPKTIADIGTGSGCIIISLALAGSGAEKYSGYDISEAALETAQKNATKHSANVSFFQDDITSPNNHTWLDTDLIVANLPYVPENFRINLAATHEPELAIFGGKDGLQYYRYLFNENLTARFVITESLPPQHPALRDIAKVVDYHQIDEMDFIQIFKKI